MSTLAAKPNTRARPAKAGEMYRGVRLQRTGGRTRFSIDQIRQAVEAAVEKNADALVSGT